MSNLRRAYACKGRHSYPSSGMSDELTAKLIVAGVAAFFAGLNLMLYIQAVRDFFSGMWR